MFYIVGKVSKYNLNTQTIIPSLRLSRINYCKVLGMFHFIFSPRTISVACISLGTHTWLFACSKKINNKMLLVVPECQTKGQMTVLSDERQ